MTAFIFLLSIALHPDTVIDKPTAEVHYIMPCTWKCSCDGFKKTWIGWTVDVKGKVYHVEGDRKDGKETPEFMRNPNKP